MAEGSGNSNTAIWVAVITVVGGLGTAIIANADKWFSSEPAPAEAASSASNAAGADTNQQGKAQAAPATGAQPDAAPPAPSAEPIEIGGWWRDASSPGGDVMRFTQTGTRYRYKHTAADGSPRSQGEGALSGRSLSHSFRAWDGGRGTCNGRIEETGHRITGECTRSDGQVWPYAIER